MLLYPLNAIALANAKNRHRRHIHLLHQLPQANVLVRRCRKNDLKITRVVNLRRALALARCAQIGVSIAQRLRVHAQKAGSFLQRPTIKRINHHLARYRGKIAFRHHAAMVRPMLSLGHHLKIVWMVVCPVLISVMDNLAMLKWPPQDGLSNKTVLGNKPPVVLQWMAWAKLPHVATVYGRMPTLIRRKFAKSRRRFVRFHGRFPELVKESCLT